MAPAYCWFDLPVDAREDWTMFARAGSWAVRPRLLWGLMSQLRIVTRLFREPRVPLLVKAVPVLAILYVLSPLDVVPDLFPVLGQIDDLTVLFLALAAFVRLCPPSVVEFHRTAAAERRPHTPMTSTDEVIDAEWRRDS